MPGLLGVPVVTTLVCLFFYTRGCGRIERPAFPAPSEFRGREIDGKTSDASRRENAESCFGDWGNVIARSDLSAVAQRAKAEATKQSRVRHSGAMRSVEPGIQGFPDVQLHI